MCMSSEGCTYINGNNVDDKTNFSAHTSVDDKNNDIVVENDESMYGYWYVLIV